MLEFPRWKYVLVIVVLAVAVLLALPNLYGQDAAMQVELKSKAAMDAAAREPVEALLKKDQIAIKRTEVDGPRLIVVFNDVNSQLKARDAVDAPPLSDTYSSALTQATRAPGWMRALGLKSMPLGLDLRGGLYLLYQVDVTSAVTQLLGSYEQSFRRTLIDDKLPFSDIVTITSGQSTIANGLSVRVPTFSTATAVQAALQRLDNTLAFTVQNSPMAVNMVLTPTQMRARQDYALEQNRTTLMNRVNEMGVSEPIVQRQGLDRINVQLPGVQNAAEVKDLLGKVATLEFRLVDMNANPIEAQQTGRVPLGDKLYKMKDGVTPILLKREVIVTGDELTQAVSTTTQEGPTVNIRLDARGADSMLRTTRQNVGRQLAVVYIEKSRQQITINGRKEDRETTSETVINNASIRGVFGPQFEVTGLTAGEGRDLALLLRSGSLAAPIEVVQEQVIGPSLGKDNIDKGVRALEIGMLAVFIFMAIYYHAFGLVADAVLLANVVLLTALLSLLRASLSLPGIAGIILTVGIAVDANVLIYERIREELRNGVSPQAAIRAGFEKAFSAIADSNVTALIAGLALYVIGTGAVRNFAIVLVLGIATSMFTSLLGSRALITLMYGGRQKVAQLSIG